MTAGRPARRRRAGGHPLSQRRRAWPWPTRWPPSRAGATQVQGTINGLGERCGNADLCVLAAEPGTEDGPHVPGPREPGQTDRRIAIRLRDRQHAPGAGPAVRRSQRLRPQGRDARGRHRQGPAHLRARRPEGGGQHAAHPGERTLGPRDDPGEGGRDRFRGRQGPPGEGPQGGPAAGERGVPVRGVRGAPSRCSCGASRAGPRRSSTWTTTRSASRRTMPGRR